MTSTVRRIGMAGVLWFGLAAASAGETTRVSVDSAGVEGNDNSSVPAVSANGRFAAFHSLADNLVAGDANGVSDIFFHERKKRITTLASVSSGGVAGNGDSVDPVLSRTGRFVAFESSADNLVAGDTNGQIDIFLRDLKKGETIRVSVASGSDEANGDSFNPSISYNGRYVAFESDANNLVVGDTNGEFDVFMHDRKSGETVRVSVDSSGGEANGESFGAAMSGNGRFIAFSSSASNLTEGDNNGVPDVFVHDRKSGQTTRVSLDSAGTEGNAFSGEVALSKNGRFVAFLSGADNLVPGDSNGVTDTFVHDRKTGETMRVSMASLGNEANASTSEPAISGNGRFVAFYSEADNLVSGDGNSMADIFVHDRRSGDTTRVSVDSAGDEVEGSSFSPALSHTGRFVTFYSSASDLVADDTNESTDVFVHDRRK